MQQRGSRGYVEETSERSTSPCSRSAVHHPRLVAGELEVDVELDAANAARGEVREALLERERRARAASP